ADAAHDQRPRCCRGRLVRAGWALFRRDDYRYTGRTDLRWHRAQGVMALFPPLSQPIALGNLTIPNRIMFTTHGPRLSQPRYLRYLEERARGGVGLMGFTLGPRGLMQFPFGPGRPSAANAADLDAVPFHPLTAEGRAYYDSLIPSYKVWADTI